jgi:hypothetical protein
LQFESDSFLTSESATWVAASIRSLLMIFDDWAAGNDIKNAV